jgi:hypothetical protein
MSSSIKKRTREVEQHKKPHGQHRGALGKGGPNQIKPFGKNVLNKIIVIKDTWKHAKDILLRNFAYKQYA